MILLFFYFPLSSAQKSIAVNTHELSNKIKLHLVFLSANQKHYMNLNCQ